MNKIVALFSAALLAALPASAGMLGTSYVNAYAGYTSITVDTWLGDIDYDGWHLGADWNTAVVTGSSVGLDMNLGVSYASIDDVDVSQVTLGVPVYFGAGSQVKLFVAPAIGYLRTEVDNYYTDDAFVYGGAVGVEFSLTEALSLTLRATSLWESEYDDSQLTFSGLANWWVSEKVGVNLGVAYVDEDGGKELDYSLGVAIKL